LIDIITHQLRIDLKTGIDMVNISDRLQRIVSESGILNGSTNITVIGSTGSITTIEYEPGVVEDLKHAINRIAPPELEYAHEKAWHDGNGHSHVQAAMIGPSLVVAIRNGKISLGTWQQIIVINHDNKPRKRPVDVTIIGTS